MLQLKRFQDWDFALQAARIYSIGYLRESLVDSFVQKDSISKVVWPIKMHGNHYIINIKRIYKKSDYLC